jgi:hypothetical protein
LREDFISVFGFQFTDGPVNSFANLEFAFITLPGQEALACWAYAHEKVGDVIRFAPDSPVVRSLEKILGLAVAKEVRNGYSAARLATQFLMDLYQTLKYKPVPSEDEPEVIEQARAMLTEHYRNIGSMREVAAQLGRSLISSPGCFTARPA